MSDKKKLKVCIVGLGYVGLPLLVQLSRFHCVTGFDIDKSKLDELKRGFDRTGELDRVEIDVLSNLNFVDELNASASEVYIITVPTPVNDDKKPDLSALINATETVASVLKDGDLVIYESTVFPGATEEICKPILEKSGLTLNSDFYIGYSPERVVPGKGNKRLSEITKIVSISDNTLMSMMRNIYWGITNGNLCEVNSIRVAESAKIFENIQRDVNIALVNEFATICDSFDISVAEVLSACSTKWNFLNFHPGLVGGHCIGVDPYYLIDKCENSHVACDLISTARDVNEKAVGRYINKLKFTVNALHEKSILLIGYSFKENCRDTRNTKVKDLYFELNKLSHHVAVLDPYATKSSDDGGVLFVDEVRNYDIYIIAVWHDEFRQRVLPNLTEIASKGNQNIFSLKQHENLEFCRVL